MQLSNLQRFVMTLILCVLGTAVTVAQNEVDVTETDDDIAFDTHAEGEARFGVAHTSTDNTDEKLQTHPGDLRTPSNVKDEIEYDWKNDRYLIRTMVGNQQIGPTLPLSRQEYLNYTERAVRAAYFRNQNNKEFESYEGGNGFDLLDMQYSLGPAEKIFGKGGIRVKTQGSASLSMGMKRNKIDNPTLSERARDQKIFDFQENIQLNMNATVGSKMSFNLSYNTESAFDFDANQFKLAYQGDEDEIIQNIEAGNVSMTTGNSLIKAGQALFGFKTKLKFGKLNITALLAKQESTSKSVSSKGGSTKRQFEIMADEYDENRHFFLAQFFRDTYDRNMSHLPLIASGVEISKIEVWVTNKKGSFDNARNILAFMDLGEAGKIGNPMWSGGSNLLPDNKANNLYQTISQQYSGIRDITSVTTTMDALESQGVRGGRDFEKVESARMLSSSEYTLNRALGYISLKTKLDDDMVLAVAFQYTMGGKTYQVGEFAGDNAGNTTQTLVVKLLKATEGNPQTPLWDLMMKNIYSLGVTNLQKKDFRLQIQYMSDTVGVYTNFINDGPIAQQLLIKVMNLDRLNANEESHSDGQFDFVNGYTVNTATGRIIFPVVEPFGSHLAAQLGSEALANRYCYQELYDSTLTVAEQIAEKNKFRLKGEYVASSGAEIALGATNVARGSVVVTAGGATLVENSDYTVDYSMGIVTILNESIIESGTAVNVSLEDQTTFSMQRKTMMGVDLQYEVSKDISFGATVLNLHEKPLTKKVTNAEIPINNTMYGINFKWNKDFMWLTNAVGAIPWVKATAPSNIAIQGEFAQLVAGHNDQIGNSGNVYIDDFENSETPTDISSASMWQLASTPYDDAAGSLFPEASLSNNIDYGKNRALLSWYTIDRMFTSQSSSMTPGHIKNDLAQLSDHRVRQVNYDEIYPNKELTYGETGILDVLNLTFYPNERGPYNLDADGIDSDGRLINPEKRWGGIMRKMDVTNFENANYEYIEFWLMDPFAVNEDADGNALPVGPGGDLYFNLGEISEDILKDGMKSFENGLDADGDTLYSTSTVWGRVARRSSTVYAFDNTAGSRKNQDVGLNGLSSDNEKQFPTYQNYMNAVIGKVSSETLSRWQADPYSPVNDPAGDDFHYFRGSDYDRDRISILDRYKHYNGTEGNSRSTDESPESYATASRSTPDVEDINNDNTLNEYERYFQYHISLRPEDMVVGSNHIESVSEAVVALRNGKRSKVKWYQFRIPIKEYDRKVGSIQNFKSIRFMRMFMTGWHQEQTLRFATLELVRSDWRNYTAASLVERGYSAAGTGQLATSTVNIEENAGSFPVNYVLPPGVDRIVDPGQSTSTQLNEQAMVLSVSDLEPHDAVAVYKNSGMDMRQYDNIQLFVHAEALVNNETNLSDGELSVFLRLGSDYKDNYYEYEVPLRLTQPGTYNNNSMNDRRRVWPDENMIDLALSKLTTLKKERNSEKQRDLSTVSFTTPYSKYDDQSHGNRLTVIGNPTLSEVSVIMIGVRNNGKTVKSGKVWVNELRMNGIDEDGGWAAKGSATLRVSDIATLNASGNYTSVGWGNIDQSAAQRSLTEDWEYSVSGQTDLGKWLPQQIKLTAPFYYSRSKAVTTPKYDPYNEDLLLEETLESYHTERQRDSIRALTQTVDETTSLSISGMKFDVKSKHSKPWDPANLSLSYSQNRKVSHDPTTEYEHDDNYKASVNYQWSPFFTPWQPWSNKKDGNGNTGKNVGAQNPANKPKNVPDGAKANEPKATKGASNKKRQRILTDFQLNWLPNSISMSSNWNRTYHEEQLRNIETYESDYTIPVTYSKTFTWLRQTAIAWDLTKTIKLNFNSATNARIDEPDAPVNKNLYPDEFEAWKDTIGMQLWKLGTPVDYNQTFDATWNIPINKLTWTDWVTATAKYKGTYEWQRGTRIDKDTETGGVLQNQGSWQGDLKFNLETLYNKSPFLKKVNERFKKQTPRNGKLNAKVTPKRPTTNKKPKEFKKTIIAVGDTVIELRHNLNTRRLIISAKNPDTGKAYTLTSTKRVDANSIRIHLKDSVKLDLVIKADTPLDDLRWYKNLQVAARGMMMVRNVNFSYKYSLNTYLPSYRLNSGDFFGQNNSGSSLAPGLGFAFGFEGGEDFTRKAIENDWLFVNDSLTTPAVYNETRDMSYGATIEPLPGLKINLTGTWKHSQKQSHQFMFDDLAITKSGSFQMTTIALGSSFGSGKAKDRYSSRAFQEMVSNRQKIYERQMSRYQGAKYPEGGFMTGYPQYAGMPYNAADGGSRLNSSDVLVPAFIAAYMGGSADKVSLSAFPDMLKTLPNWKVQYDGLLQLFPKLSEYFKTLNLSHAYTCTYSVGSYQSYTNFAQNSEGLGFMLDVAADCPVPSTEFDISTVTLSESFAPLAGVNATMNNGVSVKTEYKHTRSVSLNMSAAQIVENISKDLTVGVGYKIVEFGTKIGLPTQNQTAKTSHDLNLKLDITHKNQLAILRKIEDAYSEATSGNKAWNINFSADYQFSRMLTFKFYWQKQINTPLISTSYPTINTDFGMTLSFSLTR
ncbi:MAG: cell surface protein SprA [Bacteroidales bacterium]|nr:cell surface protein SprA [Candidatus Liminaster caballi]